MKKIPTVFVRDETDRRYVTDVVTPGCEWVLAGEGVPTRKWDGTCVMIARNGAPFVRREVRAGMEPPYGWHQVDSDEVTGKRVGWEPAGNSPFAAFIEEAIAAAAGDLEPGKTYELCGPKINRNPEGFAGHVLVPHGTAVSWMGRPPFTPADLVALVAAHSYEGIVWWHPDGRMAKLKRRDLRP